MILMTQVHPTQHRAMPFSLISIPRMPPVAGLSWDLNICVNHRTFSALIYLVVMQAALLMHGILWQATGILDAPQPL